MGIGDGSVGGINEHFVAREVDRMTGQGVLEARWLVNWEPGLGGFHASDMMLEAIAHLGHLRLPSCIMHVLHKTFNTSLV